MSWRDRLTGIAKFRGVAFYVEVAEQTGGHRGPDHEYPGNSDPPYSEPLGLQGRTFPVEGYVLGAEYLTARDQLLSALEQGVGELVHPNYGTRQVLPRSWRIREAKTEGGWARFSIEFHETSTKPRQPSARTDGRTQVRKSAAASQLAAVQAFTAAYSQASALRSGAMNALSGAVGGAQRIASIANLPAQDAADLKQQTTAAIGGVATLVGTAAGIVMTQVAVIGALADALAKAAANPAAALLPLYDFDPGQRPIETTSARQVEAANFDAVRLLTQRLVVIRAAELATSQKFESYNAAVALRERITDLIDVQAEIVADDSFIALQQLRADLVNAVPGDESDLPHLVKYTPPATVPSLVLAHRLYGDLALEADIVARNRIRHPGFIHGETELEVLTRE